MKNIILLLFISLYASCAFIIQPEGLSEYNHSIVYDIMPSTLLITHKNPSIPHSIDGYCITFAGACTGRHLRQWKSHIYEIKEPSTVWKCIIKNKTNKFNYVTKGGN